MKIEASLPSVLLPWYEDHKRDLPWRRDRDPYHIWISEIMLQQTRVEAVKGYYARFLEALPDISSLAACDDDALRKLWEGLGYYTRVRNLKKAANVIMDRFGGVFPRSHGDVLSLPGIGDYTAGAICSIAFNEKTPAVDGNVLRVISRLCNDDTPIDSPAFKKEVTTSLLDIYPEDAGAFTQALMELGATLCGPNRAPDCENCPCKGFCQGYLAGTAEKLPVKSPKKGRKSEELTVFILRCGDRYAVEKRPDKGLLASLWQFPNVPGTLETAQAVKTVNLPVSDVLRQADKNHIFTHIEWKMRGYYLTVREVNQAYTWLTVEEIEKNIALPTAFRQFWEDRI